VGQHILRSPGCSRGLVGTLAPLAATQPSRAQRVVLPRESRRLLSGEKTAKFSQTGFRAPELLDTCKMLAVFGTLVGGGGNVHHPLAR
jgi:hypothetical protein